MMTYHPELFDGMRLVPCAVMTDNDNPQAGWIFIPHADGKWVYAAKLQPFSQQIINYWWNRPSSAEVRAEAQEMHRPQLEAMASAVLVFRNEPALEKANDLRRSPGYIALCDEWERSRDLLESAPQPPAPCPKCAENASFRLLAVEHANVTANEALRYQKSIRDLQAKASEQRAEIERLNRGMTVYTEEFEAECRTTDTQSALIDLCEKALVIAYPNWEQYGDWEVNAWARDTIAAIESHKKGIAK